MNTFFACLAIVALTSQVTVSYGLRNASDLLNVTLRDDVNGTDGFDSGDEGCAKAQLNTWLMTMKLVFNLWDKNGDESLSLNEFLAQGPKKYASNLTALFQMADENENNVMELVELFMYGEKISDDWILPVQLLVSYADADFNMKVSPKEQMNLAKIILKALLPNAKMGKTYDFKEVVNTLGSLVGLA